MDMNVKIGVLSDTHLHGITKSFMNIYDKYLKNMDIILHAGDFVNVEVVEFLYGENFHGVHGNMDPFDVREMLPPKRVIELGSHRIGLMHGWGSSNGLEERVRSEYSREVFEKKLLTFYKNLEKIILEDKSDYCGGTI